MERTPIISQERAHRMVIRLAYQVLERNRGAGNVVIFGIWHSGAVIAQALAQQIEAVEGHAVPVHDLDVTAYRDDRARTIESDAVVNDIDVTDRDVVLVDDVLFTGRTARAALDAIVHYGRPRSIQLAVFIDRGHREYPIQPDYVGRVIPTKHKEQVVVEVEAGFAVYVEE